MHPPNSSAVKHFLDVTVLTNFGPSTTNIIEVFSTIKMKSSIAENKPPHPAHGPHDGEILRNHSRKLYSDKRIRIATSEYHSFLDSSPPGIISIDHWSTFHCHCPWSYDFSCMVSGKRTSNGEILWKKNLANAHWLPHIPSRAIPSSAPLSRPKILGSMHYKLYSISCWKSPLIAINQTALCVSLPFYVLNSFEIGHPPRKSSLFFG